MSRRGGGRAAPGAAPAIVLGVAPARDVLAPYADPVIFLSPWS